MRFDLTDLQLFVHVLDSGTLTAAAQRSHLTPASASERVRGMEELLGTALLVRQARGVQPTAAGHTLGQHARQVLRQMQSLRGAMGDFGSGLAAQVRLRGNTSAIREHLPLAISGFLQQHPQLALELQECPSTEVLDGLRQGLCDLGVAAWDADQPPPLADLDCSPWRSDQLVAVLAAEHPLATRSSLALADIVHENWVGLPRDSALQQLLLKQALLLEKAAVASKPHLMSSALRLRVQLPHPEGLCQLVGQNVGLCVLPAAAVRRHAAATGVVAVPLCDAWARRQLWLCTAKGISPSAPAGRLLAHLRRESAGQP
ncbi:LysR family transcriptional regulator [Comamonas guangdongensis]|uniref:LysR family transcriptional regulator n=1 Tax=Comamonas guangdongensis TaxID=510515 RepID=A0ABV4A1G6_9BURK